MALALSCPSSALHAQVTCLPPIPLREGEGASCTLVLGNSLETGISVREVSCGRGEELLALTLGERKGRKQVGWREKLSRDESKQRPQVTSWLGGGSEARVVFWNCPELEQRSQAFLFPRGPVTGRRLPQECVMTLVQVASFSQGHF